MAFPSLFGFILLNLLAHVNGQTFTSCSPLNSTCPADPALGTSFNQTFQIGSTLSSNYWKIDAGPTLRFNDDGALFTITEHGDAPTIQANFYIFWGSVEVIMRAASGQGIISSIVLLSDDLDEIDWEIMGGNTTAIETNYYGKGNTSEVNSLYYACDNPQGTYHNYTTVWTSEQLEWHLDGRVVRTLQYSNAVMDGETIYPQTPSYLKLGSWAAGDPSEPLGTRQWAGGTVNYDDGPFNMYVKSVKINDGTRNAKSYTYEGHSGNWQSIKIERGVSEASQKIHAPPPLTLSQRWNNLSPTVQIIIIVVVGVVVLALMIAFVVYCIHQRRLGRREAALEDARWEKQQAELEAYKRQMQRSEFAKGAGFVGVVQVRR